MAQSGIKLYIKSDGTPTGTTVTDPNGNAVEGVTAIHFHAYADRRATVSLDFDALPATLDLECDWTRQEIQEELDWVNEDLESLTEHRDALKGYLERLEEQEPQTQSGDQEETDATMPD